MNEFEFLKVPHANMRDEQGNLVAVELVKNQIFSWYFSPAHKCLHVVAPGGAVVPVLMKPEDFKKLFLQKPSVNEETTKP